MVSVRYMRRRQQHIDFRERTAMECTPLHGNESAGTVLLAGRRVLRLTKGHGRVEEKVDGRTLSPANAGGFVGTSIGMYATSNGKPGDSVADVDWFKYREGAGI